MRLDDSKSIQSVKPARPIFIQSLNPRPTVTKIYKHVAECYENIHAKCMKLMLMKSFRHFVLTASGLGLISFMLEGRKDMEPVKLAWSNLQPEGKAHVIYPLEENNKGHTTNSERQRVFINLGKCRN